ncbi:MAG: cobyric acid synthase, partial [Hyphomicrobiales bacterium]
MPARAIMLQGTASNVGKSLLVAGLARALSLRGLVVRPFKPQNMSNNSAVTPDGGEIGRAQALHARAARVPLSVHMNPVLLKPQSEIGAQIIVQGKVFGQANARAFQEIKPKLLPAVLESFARLKAEADIVLVEGAGSATEINLRQHDIANMGFARAAEMPVVVIGDIDRGGVIASLVGTKTVLATEDASLVAGFIVNRMRGDLSLFADGMEAIARLTGWPALGLVPFFEGARRLPAEDAYDLAETRRSRGNGRIGVAVPLLPRIANFDDLDPLSAEPDVDLIMVERGRPLPVCDLVVLPGS